jgi:hypothetical protein
MLGEAECDGIDHIVPEIMSCGDKLNVKLKANFGDHDNEAIYVLIKEIKTNPEMVSLFLQSVY